ncbi:MAG: hypothetical protein HQM04_18660 [Magnetococcales bacterium]|nr:hypothetical protein [Magnetococcales bacterium]
MEERAKRSRHGQAFWLSHIVACEQADRGVLAYLQEHGLSEQSFYRWRKKLMLSGDLPVQPAAPMFRRLEVLPPPAMLEEESLSDCKAVSAGGNARTPDAVSEAVSRCHIRFPNGVALELNGAFSTRLIEYWLQVVGALPVTAERCPR